MPIRFWFIQLCADTCQKRLGFFGGLLAEGLGFVDLGGEFFDARHDPPLFRQRGEWDFEGQDIFCFISFTPNGVGSG